MAMRLVLLVALALVDLPLSSSSSSSAGCKNTPTLDNGSVIRNGSNITDYTCNTGYRLSVTGTCRGRSWRPQVTCEDCYKNTNGFIQAAILGRGNAVNQNDCDQECSNNGTCTSALYLTNQCYLFPSPLIFISRDIGFDQCKAQCTQMNECLMLSYLAPDFCFIYNQTLNNLPDVGFPVVNNYEDATIAEKIC